MIFRVTNKQKKKYAVDMTEIVKRKSKWLDVWRRLRRNRLGMVGLTIIVLLLILVIGANLFTWHDPARQVFDNRFAYPNANNLLGTDNMGRDLWARMLYGGRISLLVAVIAVLISSVVGIILGAVAGYTGGKTDLIIMRINDILMSIPALLLAIAVAFTLGPNPINTAIAIAIPGIAPSLRLIRSTVMAIKSNEFIEAARASGSKHFRIIFVHVIPNTIAPLIVNASLSISGSIMAISGLSFVNLGVQPPTPEWGSILANGRAYLLSFWPIIVFPALFIALTMFGFNLLGDGLRDSLDPRLKD